MTIANDLIFLSLRNSGVSAIGQTPMAQDVNDAQKILNAMINEWNMERRVKVNPVVLPTFPDLTTDVPFWSSFEHVLLTTMAVRLRQIYSLPPIDLDLKLAVGALEAFNAINQHYIAPLHPGPPETVIQALFLALRMAGRITDTQSVSDGSKDVADAFSLLVMMLGQWQRKRWLVWHEEDVALVSTGADFYTIGPGEDFDVARPDKIHAAKVILGPGFGTTAGLPLPEQLPFPLGAFGGGRTPNLVNIPLAIIEAKEDWNKIAIPDLKSIPSAVFYDSSFPVGRIYFWPVAPANTYEMQLTVKGSLPVYTSVNDALELPPEYMDAVVNNLAVRIALVSPGAQVSPLLLAEARASLNTIKLANTQIPLLSMPAALVGRRGGDVSSWSGRGLDTAWVVGGANVLG
jgi:hypothetical protein